MCTQVGHKTSPLHRPTYLSPRQTGIVLLHKRARRPTQPNYSNNVRATDLNYAHPGYGLLPKLDNRAKYPADTRGM